MEKQNIPLVDLKAQYSQIKDEVEQAVRAVWERGDYILGRDVALFEEKLAEFCGTEFCVSCGSGTDAIHLACRALGLGKGDEVIMPAMTFVATALGISLSGAKPVLVDVEPETGLLDLEAASLAITPQTKAIIPVHLYGQCVDAVVCRDLAKKNNLILLEDAAQAHGARSGDFRAGSIGTAGCFSFYPGKNLGAYGDGGAITTNDKKLDKALRLWRNWGSSKKYHHEEMGLNSRLDTVQAAILNVKLRYLDSWNDNRRKHAKIYAERLSSISGVTLTKSNHGSVYHLYIIRVRNRDAVLKKLHEAGIGAGIHYPFAVHELKAYRWLGYKDGDFPVAEKWARECLSLPIYSELPEETIDRVAEVLKDI